MIINSGGFKETGAEGERLQQQFLAEARRHGIRVLGPNCQGIINTDPGFRAYCNFTNTLPQAGSISLAALSGGVGGFILQGLADIGVGLRMYASNGNACDVSIAEILRYWGDDDGTAAIVVYTEGFADPKEFLDVARDVAARKPVLAMKAGRTEQGAKAAASHTGSLAGVDMATELIFDKAGILSFTDEGELIRAAMAFATQPIPQRATRRHPDQHRRPRGDRHRRAGGRRARSAGACGRVGRATARRACCRRRRCTTRST